jgi:hypothetical protein
MSIRKSAPRERKRLVAVLRCFALCLAENVLELDLAANKGDESDKAYNPNADNGQDIEEYFPDHFKAFLEGGGKQVGRFFFGSFQYSDDLVCINGHEAISPFVVVNL